MNRATRTLMAAMTLAVAAPGPVQAGMQDYRWKNRPLVVFAPSDSHALYRRQVAALSGKRSQLANRDMVVIQVVGGHVVSTLGRSPGLSADALRRRYGVGPASFRAILVGKDGGVKISSAAPLSASRLFATIDAMPMRRQEMRTRGQ